MGLCEPVSADLIVLPEMAATGYVFPSVEAVRPVAEVAGGETFAALSPVARAKKAWVVCGFPEIDGDRVFNSAYVIDPAGELAFVYRKTLLYEADLPWASPGDSGYRVFDDTFTVGICMDLNDNAFVRWVGSCGANVVAFPTNWVKDEDSSDPWEYWAWRLIGRKAVLVAANTYGVDEGVAFSGRSCVLDVERRLVLAHTGETGDVVVSARVL